MVIVFDKAEMSNAIRLLKLTAQQPRAFTFVLRNWPDVLNALY